MGRIRTINDLINKCPCLDCDKRQQGCHKECKPYKEWEHEHERLKKKKMVVDYSNYFLKFKAQDHKHKFPKK